MHNKITESEWILMELLWQREMTQPQLAEERQNFLKRVYQENVENMVASFGKDNQLSAKEAEER